MSPIRLLLADDHPVVRAGLRALLESEPDLLVVDEVTTAEAAVTRAGAGGVDVVLLDWMLPLMSGIEVCRQLRRQTSTANLPIIMLTARGEEGDRVRVARSVCCCSVGASARSDGCRGCCERRVRCEHGPPPMRAVGGE